jgi:tetratricopeptide (TPR) repeat protein
LAEASIRETLGSTYLDLEEPAPAVKQLERALALREAMLGDDHPATLACRNKLAVAYRRAGRPADASRLYDQDLNSSSHASALAIRGSALLSQKKPVEAELKLRECLAIREKLQPDDWTTFDTKSQLGEALLEQKKYAHAEPLLLSGYEGLKQREAQIPSLDKAHLAKALARLVRLYEAQNNKDKAAQWRKELERAEAAKKA